MKIADKVVELVAEAFSVDASTLKMETQFGLDLDESLELAELVLRCEEEFDIKLEESEIAQRPTIGGLTELIAEKLRQKPLLSDEYEL
jgi:acyl carrier protein